MVLRHESASRSNNPSEESLKIETKPATAPVTGNRILYTEVITMTDYMIKLKSGAANYKRIKPYLLGADHNNGHFKYTSEGYEDLVVENLGYVDTWGNPVYSVTHYYEQNGDLMSDPDMAISVNDRLGWVMPLTFQNDGIGLYQQVFTADGKRYNPRLMHDLDNFLSHWTKNIIDQGFDPAQPWKQEPAKI